MKHKFVLVISFYIGVITSILPDFPMLMRLRGLLYSLFMVSSGENFQVSRGVSFKGLEQLAVGNNVYIAPNCKFILRDGCNLGDDIMIGPNCVIVDGNHGFDGSSYRYNHGKSGLITIESGCWLGANVVVTQSARIGRATVVGANSVVSGNLKPESVYVARKAELLDRE